MKTRCIKNKVIIVMDAQEYDEMMEVMRDSEDYLIYQMYFKFKESEE